MGKGVDDIKFSRFVFLLRISGVLGRKRKIQDESFERGTRVVIRCTGFFKGAALKGPFLAVSKKTIQSSIVYLSQLDGIRLFVHS